MKRRAGLVLPVVASLVVFVLAWQLIVFVAGYPSFILPGPYTVAERFIRAWSDGMMWPHTQTTLVEVLLGFAIGASIGYPIMVRPSYILGGAWRAPALRSGSSAPTWSLRRRRPSWHWRP